MVCSFASVGEYKKPSRSESAANKWVSPMIRNEPACSILEEGNNCWRKSQASRVSFLIDGQAYFDAFVDAVEQAENCILIAGWDIDSRVALRRENYMERESYCLGSFLNRMAAGKRNLHIYILAWDFAMIYAFEREPAPVFKLGWQTHRRVHFAMDGRHPLDSSHHQKIVVVDDRIAFVGGLDLTRNRWDTPEHKVNDARRTNPGGAPYDPFHDVQLLVEGEAAADLGDLFRTRWERATEKILKPPKATEKHDTVWPIKAPPDLQNVTIGISRTIPAHQDWQEVREVESLYLKAIASARKYIYIENQYLTSSAIGKALASRLQEKDCPEILIVLPKRSPGWLEERTMTVLRSKLIGRLRQADQNGRLGIYYPDIQSLSDGYVLVHAKVMIVDDNLAIIGSANLTNRSMRVDTECIAALEAAGDPIVEAAISGLRGALLGEHLGITPGEAVQALHVEGSLFRVVEKLGDSGRTLKPLKEENNVPDVLFSFSEIADPERPIDFDHLMEQFVPDDNEEFHKLRLFRVCTFILLLLVLAAFWKWGPLAEWFTADKVADWLDSVNESRIALLFVIGGYLAGGLLIFPVTVLIGVTVIVFDPPYSVVYALCGCLSSAALGYLVGERIGPNAVRKVLGTRINRVSKRLAQRGMFTMVLIRLLPLAPFSFVNIAVGVSHIKFRDFMIGTFLGMAPGILALAVAADRINAFIENPQWENLVLLVCLLALLTGAIIRLRRRLGG